VERRDEAAEAKQFSQQGLRNSRASLSAGFFFGIRASKQVVAGGRLCRIASAQTRRHAGRGQGLKILAREAENMAARNVPISQANWSWDCTTPQTALTGILVSVGAIVFLRKTDPSMRIGISAAGMGRPGSRTDGRRFYARKAPQLVTVRRQSSLSHIGITACTANVSDVGRY
jgi:hypothetical protein